MLSLPVALEDFVCIFVYFPLLTGFEDFAACRLEYVDENGRGVYLLVAVDRANPTYLLPSRSEPIFRPVNLHKAIH